MKRSMIAVVGLVAVLLAATGVHAGIAVNWSTGGAYMENLGNTCHTAFSIFPADSNRWDQADTQCDKVTLGVASGSLELAVDVPQTVVVNPLSFEIGWTGDMIETDTKSNVYTLTRDITVNGITKSLVQTVTHGVTYYQDSLIVNAGAPVAFGDILVTPLGWTTGFFSDAAGPYTQTSPSWHTIAPVSAEFSLIPEPASMALLVLGGTGLLRRRRGL
ncbi:MAG: PEP-CTERM sorting domain-containing protein [Phycisphaerae bacterium]